MPNIEDDPHAYPKDDPPEEQPATVKPTVTMGDPPDDADTAEMEQAPGEEPRYGYRHVACGGMAFYVWRKPPSMGRLAYKDLLRSDGTTIAPHETLMCGHCGLAVGPLQPRHVMTLAEGQAMAEEQAAASTPDENQDPE